MLRNSQKTEYIDVSAICFRVHSGSFSQQGWRISIYIYRGFQITLIKGDSAAVLRNKRTLRDSITSEL